MTSASMTFGRPTRITIPRGAAWAAAAAASLTVFLRKLDQWLLAKDATTPSTPEEVLDWAQRVEAYEPGFASDLRAAALRAMGRADEV